MRRLLAPLALLAIVSGCGSKPERALTPQELARMSRLERLEMIDWESGHPIIDSLLDGIEVARLEVAKEITQWRASGGTTWRNDEGRLVVRADEGGDRVVVDRGGLNLKGTSVDALLIDVEVVEPAEVRVVTFTQPEKGGKVEPREHKLSVPAGGHRLDIPLAEAGVLSALRIDLPNLASLGSIGANRRQFDLAASPTMGPHGYVDVGLGYLERNAKERKDIKAESRRGVPLLPGKFQLALYEGGGHPLLFSALALSKGAVAAGDTVEIEVLAREAVDADPSSGTKVIHRQTLKASKDSNLWFPFKVELPGGPGESWEVFFRATGGKADRVNAIVAAPVLVRCDVPRPPDLVLVTADTLRADHIGANRKALGLGPLPGLATPFIDSLAAAGVNFVDAMAASNATSPSHSTILTGLYARDHRVRNNERVLDEQAVTLAELIRDDYYCVASVTARHLNSPASGLGQGFDLFYEVPLPIEGGWTFGIPKTLDDLPPVNLDDYNQRGAAFANPRLEQFLAESGELPLFLWTHYFDPHSPYVVRDEIAEKYLLPEDPSQPPFLQQIAEARAKYRGLDVEPEMALQMFLIDVPALAFTAPYHSIDRLKSLYAAGITQYDTDLSELFAKLESQDRDPIVVFTADHGESLGERDIWFGHEGTYDNTLRVPLIIGGPGIEGGRVDRAPVSTVDIVPTLLGLLDIEGPEYLPGVDILTSPPPADRRRWFQHAGDLTVGFREGDRHAFMITRDHLIGTYQKPQARGAVVVEVDGEAVEVSEEEAKQVTDEIRDWMFAPVINLHELNVQLSASDRAGLRALGYAGD
ncbi:sulfatase [Engelhardtia mirabilis]|uniref:Choline-sulfatase n=1 Tax=Engelhardtia mirabilis TaxID=2528011 RepID=A0A518BQ39_9BACT|nr:Choline-sulfatase [Planctomycetes bacterium Pla133]QDV03422.1 Choline-sulfatase [Planctomycetes bacterium Pla86]